MGVLLLFVISACITGTSFLGYPARSKTAIRDAFRQVAPTDA